MSNLIDDTPRSLGDTLSVGPLGFGCWRLVDMDAAAAQRRVEAALDAGMTLVDTADVYGFDWGGAGFGDAEALLGKVLKSAPQLRERMVLASKGGIIPGVPYDSAYVAEACENSLSRLHVEQLDLYQIHRPDLLTHPQEVARVLEDLRAKGKIREVGVSNFRRSQVDALQAHLPFPIVSQQPEYSALQLAPLFDGTFDHCMQHGAQVLAWSPLAGGRLAQTDGLSDALAQCLQQLAEREGVSLATLAVAFVLAHPTRPVALIGSMNPDRYLEISGATRVHLSRADVYAVIQASMGENLP